MKKNEFSRYNDGVVFIYREKSKRNDFSAKENVATKDDLQFIVKLDFEESAKREQDVTFAEQNGFSLSMKVKTRFVKDVAKNHKAIIDGFLYDISYIDKNKTEMWLYLEGIRQVEGVKSV